MDIHFITVLVSGERLPDALAAYLDGACSALEEAFALEGPLVFFVSHVWPGDLWMATLRLPCDYTGDPEAALERFDACWGLAHAEEVEGALVIDYE